MIYAGALWGDWFDWELLRELALGQPRASLVVIGDVRHRWRGWPSNIHFTGLLPQAWLPAFLSRADVAIIPWKVSPVTQATSPLKVYEYLAMGLPVVAPRLKPLACMPGVLLAKNRKEFVALVEEARHLRMDEKVIADFVKENCWERRLDRLLRLIARTAADQDRLEHQ